MANRICHFAKNPGVWTNFELMECNILAFSTLDPISTIPEWVGEMGSNVLRDKRLCSIGSKLVQTPVRRVKHLSF